MSTPKFIIAFDAHWEQIIKAAMPRVNNEYMSTIIDKCKEWQIFDERLCMFLAQVGHESADLNRLSESLNYAVTALTVLFGPHRISREQIEKYGRKAGQPANQEALANILYGGEWGRRNLGNTEPGDGWKFRGRGAKQITGRANYKKSGDAIGVDLINNPELLADDITTTLDAACWFFTTRTSGIDIVQVSRQVNGGTIGLDDRKKRYEAALSAYEEVRKEYQ